MTDPFVAPTPEEARLSMATAPQAVRPLGLFEDLRLNFEMARTGEDWGWNQTRWRNEAIQEIEGALQERGWTPPRQLPGDRASGALQRRQRIASMIVEMERQRGIDPTFLPDYAGVSDLDSLNALVEQRRRDKMAALAPELAGSHWAAGLGGGLAAGLLDPSSYIPVAGQERAGLSIARQILTVGAREGAANAAFAIATEPLVRDDAETLGVDRDLGDTVYDVSLQAAVGFVIGSAGQGVASGVENVRARGQVDRDAKLAASVFEDVVRAAEWDTSRDGAFVADAMSPDRYGYDAETAARAGTTGARDAAQKFARAVPPDQRTAEERAALSAVIRAAEVDESAPLTGGEEGRRQHRAALDDEMAAADEGSSSGREAPIPKPSRNAAIERASFMQRVAGVESGGNNRARNPRSSAAGLYQFIDSTWSTYHRRLYGSDGLDQKFDLSKREAIMKAFTDDNERALRRAGVDLTAGNYYLAHFAGSGGAIKLHRAAPDTPVEQVLGARAVAANPFLAGMTARDVIEWADGKMGGEGGTVGNMARDAEAVPMAEPIDEDELALLTPEAIEGEPTVAQRILGGEDLGLELIQFGPDDVDVDAELMQFKLGGDDMGVTASYERVDRWNRQLADPLTIWEGRDGRRVVADGHQRHGIARRSQAAHPDHPVVMDGWLLREKDGYSARDARLLAAFRNIAQDHGTPVDFARVLDETGGVIPPGIDAAKNQLRDARGIVKLSGDARAEAIAGTLPADQAGMVGNLLPFAERQQLAIIDLLKETQPPNLTQATQIARDAIRAGFDVGEQGDLFGGVSAQSRIKDRARILDQGLSVLRRRRMALNTAAKEADTLEKAGSRIERDASKKEAQDNAQAIDIIARLAGRDGQISEALDAAVDAFKLGTRIGKAAEQFADTVADLDLDTLVRAGGERSRPAAVAAGDGLGPERYASDAASGDRSDGARSFLDVREELASSERQAKAADFGDPADDAARAQGDALEHDARMAMEDNPSAADRGQSEQTDALDADAREGDGDMAQYRLDEDGEPRSLRDIMEDVDELDESARILRECMKPKGRAA